MPRLRLSSALLLLLPLGAQTGIVTTIAGTGTRGFSGDGGPAKSAAIALANLQNQCDPSFFEQTSHIAVDAKGNVYFADSNNQRIRRIDTAGTITTIAGDGAAPAANCGSFPFGSAHLFNPADVLPMANGSVLIADQQNNRILSGSTTIVGNGQHNLFAPGNPATSSPMDWPVALAVDSAGLVYFAELHGNRIGRVNANGTIGLVAGTGFPGTATLTKPAGIAIDSAGNVLIADTGNHRIRKAANGVMTTIAGGTQGFCGDGGPAVNACFDTPMDVKVDGRGNIYIADTGNHRIRRIDTAGNITTVAGTGAAGRGADNIAATASALSSPCAIALDANGDLYIVDWQNYLIRKVSFPSIPAGGIVDGASFSAPPAPGGIFTIFGANFAAATEAFSTVPLPMALAGVSVEVNGKAVPLYLVSPGQINAQLPFDVAPGQASAVIVTPGGRAPAVTFTVAAAAPAIFVATFVAIGTADAVVAYVTGLGAVSPAVPTGSSAPLDVLSFAQATVTATLGGVAAPVQFAGLAPGFVGLGQVNVIIPNEAPKGDSVPLVLEINGQKSKSAPVAIR
ncbi:MAG: repeat containing protein [Candidatus Solibacter sp.]|nr:repeat containing protein [Candidatus Solibacter sp.]